MAALHLIKLCVGADSIADLAQWQQGRLAALARASKPAELVHETFQYPKRAAELLAGGSLYWVIKGEIACRQRLIDVRALDGAGEADLGAYAIAPRKTCGLVLAPELITVAPRPRRPFQGWRYLAAADAPPDLGAGSAPDDGLAAELARLGLI